MCERDEEYPVKSLGETSYSDETKKETLQRTPFWPLPASMSPKSQPVTSRQKIIAHKVGSGSKKAGGLYHSWATSSTEKRTQKNVNHEAEESCKKNHGYVLTPPSCSPPPQGMCHRPTFRLRGHPADLKYRNGQIGDRVPTVLSGKGGDVVSGGWP